MFLGLTHFIKKINPLAFAAHCLHLPQNKRS
jgi:hypothetical protein